MSVQYIPVTMINQQHNTIVLYWVVDYCWLKLGYSKHHNMFVYLFVNRVDGMCVHVWWTEHTQAVSIRKGGDVFQFSTTRKPEVLSDRFRCLQYQRDVYSFM